MKAGAEVNPDFLADIAKNLLMAESKIGMQELFRKSLF